MSLRTVGIFALLAVVLGLAVYGYRTEHAGATLYSRYFEPTPVEGYGTQRALGEAALETEESIYRQAVLYHQQGTYDLALVALRAYLEGQEETMDYRPYLLAITAAMAHGAYTEAAGYLERMPREAAAARNAYYWYTALLDLREEQLASAATRLQTLRQLSQGQEYPAARLLAELPD